MRANGHSCSSRHTFLPITKMRTGDSIDTVGDALEPPIEPGHFSSSRSILPSGPKSTSPSFVALLI